MEVQPKLYLIIIWIDVYKRQAQVNNINLENNSWFVAFAPYDEPEIAIVVFIPSGYAGGYSGYTVRVIAEHYLDQKYNTETDEVPEQDSIIY